MVGIITIQLELSVLAPYSSAARAIRRAPVPVSVAERSSTVAITVVDH